MALPVSAQHEGHEGMIGWVPQELLERSVALRQGIGRVHAQVTTAVPQAQAFYDQGFAYLHSFEWIEAARSFHQALRLDPQMAMAYLGLSDAYLGLSDSPAAHAALLRAESLKEAATEAERRKIEIRGLLLAWLDSGGNITAKR
jgi:tetratricopeptide (TPR) repeat protein